jgi:hypothetical protein
MPSIILNARVPPCSSLERHTTSVLRQFNNLDDNVLGGSGYPQMYGWLAKKCKNKDGRTPFTLFVKLWDWRHVFTPVIIVILWDWQ